jgi:hypothetical protein
MGRIRRGGYIIKWFIGDHPVMPGSVLIPDANAGANTPCVSGLE